MWFTQNMQCQWWLYCCSCPWCPHPPSRPPWVRGWDSPAPWRTPAPAAGHVSARGQGPGGYTCLQISTRFYTWSMTGTRRIRRRKKLFLALEASFLLSAWQITSGKSFGLETLLLLSAVTFWNVHVQYFAQNNLNMKCQFYAKASLSLLLILHGQGHMWVYPQHPGHQPQSRRSLEVVYYCSFVFGTFSPDAHWRMSRWKIKSWRLSKKTIEQLLISL